MCVCVCGGGGGGGGLNTTSSILCNVKLHYYGMECVPGTLLNQLAFTWVHVWNWMHKAELECSIVVVWTS